MMRSMKTEARARVHKFTVGIPETLYELGEEERVRAGVSRSQYVANLYRAHLREVARQEKIARYAAAYGSLPATPEEDALTSMSEAVLASDST
jgi:metal-responsive CopG/Arc/MetJ family transcriptional regulator